MAFGPYVTPPSTIGETKLDGLLSSYNTPIGSGTNPNASLAEEFINLRLFNNSPFTKISYMNDSSGASLTMTSRLLLEYGSGGSDTMSVTTDGMKSVIVLGGGTINLTDLGSTGDKGDVITAADVNSVNQFIQVIQGNNFVVAGSTLDTLMGGMGKDTLVGGGATSIKGGSGDNSIVGGATKSAHDTLVGGSGSDTLSVAKGNNVIVAGSGTDSIFSGDKGSGGGTGGDSISLTAGGNAMVSIGGGAANDSVYFGGSAGDDTIDAKGNVAVLVQSTEVLSKVDTLGGTTTLSFKDGQTLTYSGSGHVTINFNGF